jgi:hypothetical protein
MYTQSHEFFKIPPAHSYGPKSWRKRQNLFNSMIRDIMAKAHDQMLAFSELVREMRMRLGSSRSLLAPRHYGDLRELLEGVDYIVDERGIVMPNNCVSGEKNGEC